MTTVRLQLLSDTCHRVHEFGMIALCQSKSIVPANEPTSPTLPRSLSHEKE
jgi:hypothetical protein